jgi:hypothetical protein
MRFCNTSSSTFRRTTSSPTSNAYRNASAGLPASPSSGGTTVGCISDTGTRSIESDKSFWAMWEMWIGRPCTCTGRGWKAKAHLFWTASSRDKLIEYKNSKSLPTLGMMPRIYCSNTVGLVRLLRTFWLEGKPFILPYTGLYSLTDSQILCQCCLGSCPSF